MFNFFAKKLEGEEIVEAIKTLRTEKGSKKNKAFTDLRDTFAGLIFKKVKAVGSLAHTKEEREEMQHHIETSFLEVLMEPNLKLDDYKSVIGYIASAFNTKINIHSIQKLLGHNEIITDVWRYKVEFKNALKRYMNDHNKKAPDFDDEDELADFSKNYMNKKVETVLDILKMFSASTIRSMQQEVGGNDSDDNAITLMDTIKSKEPLPDTVLHDKRLVETLMKVVDKKLTPDQKKIFLLYYLPDNPETNKILNDAEKNALDGKEKERIKELSDKDRAETKEKPMTNIELSEITGITERNVRHYLGLAREQIRDSEELKELVASRRINVLVKYAMKNYYSSEEDIIQDVVKTVMANLSK